MAFDRNAIAAFTAADVDAWSWTDDAIGAHVGYIADQEEGASMGLAFVRFRKGVSFDFAWPYDELSVVTRGSLSIRTGGRMVTAREGELLTQPRGVPGTFAISEDMEMICVHHPTFAAAFGMTLREYDARTASGDEPATPVVAPREPRRDGALFDPAAMQSFGVGDVPEWITVAERPGAHVGYLADQAEGWPMGLAFSDFRAGGRHEFSFPYDEVAAVTRGRFTVHGQGRSRTVHAGQLLYLPRNTTAVFEIEEDTVAVGMHHPTYQEATGAPPHQA